MILDKCVKFTNIKIPELFIKKNKKIIIIKYDEHIMVFKKE